MLPQHYPIESRVFFAGEYPGDPNPETARTKILALVELGVRTFIDLTAPADRMMPYESLFRELPLEPDTKLRRISLPVPDMGVPSSEEGMATIMDAIRKSMTTGPAIYLHCWGGIGRTGTVVGCWLREGGLGPEEALMRVQQLYTTHMPKSKKASYPESPQTPEQKNYIRNWKRHR